MEKSTGLAPSHSPSILWNELAGWFLRAQQLLPELPEDGSQDPPGLSAEGPQAPPQSGAKQGHS